MMMIRPLILALCLSASPALATQEYILPTLFDVAGVAADDTLNIRAEPSAGADIIGRIAPDATGVEVVETRGNWGRVNMAETSGWVAMRYLSYRTDVWMPGRLPDGLVCTGTEPFWSMRAVDGRIIWDTPGGGEVQVSGLHITDSAVPRDPRRGLLAEDDHNLIAAAITPKACSDGMSDRHYGLETIVILNGRLVGDKTQMMTGCCLIARPLR
ncbi:MAG: SH3 domain-containing protein [Paracoccus sp. (in: a-proteobacteria)]|nr:SH3 domain-containing protein [Paracoccus sp. (in: a-proteobacteria)]